MREIKVFAIAVALWTIALTALALTWQYDYVSCKKVRILEKPVPVQAAFVPASERMLIEQRWGKTPVSLDREGAGQWER